MVLKIILRVALHWLHFGEISWAPRWFCSGNSIILKLMQVLCAPPLSLTRLDRHQKRGLWHHQRQLISALYILCAFVRGPLAKHGGTKLSAIDFDGEREGSYLGSKCADAVRSSLSFLINFLLSLSSREVWASRKRGEGLFVDDVVDLVLHQHVTFIFIFFPLSRKQMWRKWL